MDTTGSRDAEKLWLEIRKIVAGGAHGPRAAHQIRRLIELVSVKGCAGADLRQEAYAIADEPSVKLWLDQSEERRERLPGPARLKKLRIKGELRVLYGLTEGMGIARPRLPDATRERETKLFARRDELLWLPVDGVWRPQGWRPLQPLLESEVVRAMLFMRARAFERAVWKEMVPGALRHRRGERLLFDAERLLSHPWTKRRIKEFR